MGDINTSLDISRIGEKDKLNDSHISAYENADDVKELYENLMTPQEKIQHEKQKNEYK